MREGLFNVTMIASLRDYKGVPEFLALAERLAKQRKIRFVLVLNDDPEGIARYFSKRSCPGNVKIVGRVSDTSAFYENASLVLNLSRADLWIETFGMTILEAMAYGIPVIAPMVGGPTELVINGVHGYLVDSRNIEQLADRVLQLFSDQAACRSMSDACRARAVQYSTDRYVRNIRSVMMEY
jgi:glycosyltransferase involved in cell wall biosynthesis